MAGPVHDTLPVQDIPMLKTARSLPSTLTALALSLICVSCKQAEPASSGPPAVRIRATTPIPRKGAWWVSRHEAKLAQVEEGEVELLLLGDSITHCWEDRGAEVWQRWFGRYRTLNIGFSADRTEHVLWRLAHGEVDGIAPKLAMVMIGTNNSGQHKDPPADTAQGVKAIIGELRRRLPDTPILLLAIFPRGADDSDPLRRLNMETNRLIAGLHDGERVIFKDINRVFLGPDRTLSRSIMPDLLHPNARGYDLWAAAVAPIIKKYVGR